VIAAGCDSITPETWFADENMSPSFLARARPLIGDASVKLTWGGGDTTIRALDGRDAFGALTYQQCTLPFQISDGNATGMTPAQESTPIPELSPKIFPAFFLKFLSEVPRTRINIGEK
jgi:hypothetical protein